MKLRAGDLNRRIDFERMRKDTDELNATVASGWESFAAFVPAAFKPLSGEEIVQAGQQAGQARAEFWIRFRDDITLTDRIKFGDRIFDIVDIQEMNFRDGLRIAAIERRRKDAT